MATAEEAYGDVVEICALLQCLGFSVKSLDNSDTNSSQDGIAAGTRSVVINCQTSGLRVVMEGGNQLCSCPLSSLQTSGFWQVSAVTGGKKRDTESGSSILASLPKEFREQLSREVRDLVRSIRGHNESQHDISTAGNLNSITNDDAAGIPGTSRNLGTLGNPGSSGNPGTSGGVLNRSVSNVELKTTPPQKCKLNVKADTPTRYRSLDTLTNRADPDLPMPGPLAKPQEQARPNVVNRLIYQRQNTYDLESPETARGSNRTSSPIRQVTSGQMVLVNMLLEAEGAADKLRERLTDVIKVMAEESLMPVADTSVSSMALDVSKISVAKGNEGLSQYASSPNIRSQPTDPAMRPRPNLFESVSTLNLAPMKTAPGNSASGKTSKLRKFSPTIFKRKESPSVGDRAGRLNDAVRSCPRPRIATPVQRTPKADTSTNKSITSSLKKKYGHIKSTIPRFTGSKTPVPKPEKP